MIRGPYESAALPTEMQGGASLRSVRCLLHPHAPGGR